MSSISSLSHLAWRIACAVAVWALCSGTVYAQPALLDMPLRVAVDAQSNVFVTEGPAMRIAKFNASGALVARFGSPGTAPGQFSSVQDLAIDPAGNVLSLIAPPRRCSASQMPVYSSIHGSCSLPPSKGACIRWW